MSRLSIPVQIDSIITSAEYEQTRCIYYRVEVVDGFAIKKTGYLSGSRAFFGAGVSWAFLAGPEQVNGDGGPLFDSPELITKTINGIHANKELSLELGYIWVPNEKFREGFVGEAIQEGDIYRLSLPYFLHCYRFVTERISEEEWLHPLKRFIQPVQPSPQETLAFRQWRQAQILISRERYHQPEYAAYRLSKKREEL